jgi:hypothetical protein
MAAWSGSLGEQSGEPLHPPVDADVVDLDATLGEQLFDIAVRQAEAEIPADGEDDHVGREAAGNTEGPTARLQRPTNVRPHQRPQGPGNVAVCTECPNLPVVGIWLLARTNAVA